MAKSPYLVMLWMAAIIGASSIPGVKFPENMPPDYVSHFIEYSIFGFLFYIWSHTRVFKNNRLFAIIFTIVAVSLYGALDEFYQSFIPGRMSDPRDWMTDSVGGMAGALLSLYFLRAHTYARQKNSIPH